MAVLGRKTSQRETRRAATEEQLLDATKALLAEGEPFGEVTIEEIASKAGVSRTGFYDYFRDKRELLIRLVDDAVTPVVEEADELIGGRPSGPGEIPYTIRAAMSFATRSREVFTAAVEAASYDPVVASYWHEEVLDRFISAIERRIRQQQKNGEALPVNPRAAAVALVSMVTHSLYHHVTRDDKVSDEKLVASLVTLSVRAVYGEAAETALASR